MEDPDRCTSCNGVNLEQDIDVLDTWFSSGLWPFATMGWPDETEDLNRFYPNTVMETGFDIIFFWVARMIMMGHKFMGEAPFQTVYLHAMVRDEKGEKMSKTKGNVIDPLEVIKDHGADPLRFTLAMMAGQGRDIKLSLQRVAGYRAFCNKLWNATRFVLMNVEDMDAQAFERGRAGAVGMQERWILSKLQQTVDDCDQALQEYRFNDAASSIYQFSWHTFCDWYVELSKHALKDESDSAKREATQATLLRCLEGVLRLLHPMMPHMTERLWQALPQFARSDAMMLIVAPWPKNEQFSDDDGVIEGLQDHVNDVVSAIRNLRSERQIAPKIRLQVQMYSNRTELVSALQENKEQVSALCRLESLTVAQGEPQDLKDGASLLLVGDTQVVLFVPVDEAGLKEERARLEKQIAKVEENLAHIDRKLNNPSFVDRAPEAVVAKERERRAQAQEELEKYQERLNQIG